MSHLTASQRNDTSYNMYVAGGRGVGWVGCMPVFVYLLLLFCLVIFFRWVNERVSGVGASFLRQNVCHTLLHIGNFWGSLKNILISGSHPGISDFISRGWAPGIWGFFWSALGDSYVPQSLTNTVLAIKISPCRWQCWGRQLSQGLSQGPSIGQVHQLTCQLTKFSLSPPFLL